MPFRGKPPSVDPTSGYIGIQTHTGRVAFRNTALYEGLAGEPERADPARPASRVLFDPERLPQCRLTMRGAVNGLASRPRASRVASRMAATRVASVMVA